MYSKIFLLITIAISLNTVAKQSSVFKNYKLSAEKIELQENCKPRYLAADTSVKYKGTIVALHGFTACPQQYFDIAENRWSKEGYDVYLLLMPGHGEVWKTDNGLALNLPGHKDWKKRYTDIGKVAVDILKETKGEKVITGLSVGGAVAVWATVTHPELIDRALITSPYLTISNEDSGRPDENFFINLFKEQVFWFGTTFTPEKIESWGDGCIIEERKLGRAGVCSFKRKAIAGIERFGDYVVRLAEWSNTLQNINKKPFIQFVGVDKDLVASNLRNYQLLNALKARGLKVESCLYPAPANHSLISKFDTPSEDKFWIESFTDNSVRFLNGKSFDLYEDNPLSFNIVECR